MEGGGGEKNSTEVLILEKSLIYIYNLNFVLRFDVERTISESPSLSPYLANTESGVEQNGSRKIKIIKILIENIYSDASAYKI